MAVLGTALLAYLARRFQSSKAGQKSAVSAAPPKASHAQIRTHLLEQLQVTWLDGLLENSLYHAACQELGIEPESERPWTITLQWPNLPAQSLPPTTSLLAPFNDLGGAMLILGDPGSGKTTTLLELARELRQVALTDDRQPIPLLFNLSSWTVERPHLFDWLTDQLNLNYGIQPASGYDWLEAMPYHLLLDGLDEVPAEHRQECLETIDQFHQDSGPVNMVLCSRTADYNQLTQRPPFKGTLVIQPLSDKYINHFLNAANPGLAQRLPNDPALNELAQNPFTLNLLALTYRDTVPVTTTPETGHSLFSSYVSRMLDRAGGPKTAEKSQSIHYLSWLAARLRERHQTVYHIENTQPDWLGRHKPLYTLASIFLFGLGFLLIFWLMFGIMLGINGELGTALIDSFKIALVFSVIGVIIGAFSQIKPANIFKVNWNWWLGGFGFGLLVGLGLRYESDRIFLSGLVSGLSYGLIYGLIGGLKGKITHLKSAPNQRIRLPARYSLIAMLFFGLSCSLSSLGHAFTIPRLTTEGDNPLLFGLAMAMIGLLIGGLFGGLRFGGSSYIKQTILRRFLARYDYLPYDLIPFLDDMADHLLLRKVGGGYTFPNRLLLDYFADLEKYDS